MNKLLILCGPTSVGKTSLGLYLAKCFGGEIISADSRQVYKGMDIGTGKDLPLKSQFHPKTSQIGYYIIKGVRVWGYDFTDPQKQFSVAQYQRLVEFILRDIRKRKRLPILVGGTGLYIRSIVDGIPTAKIPRNENLRKSLEKMTPDELFEHLAQVDSIKAASMNFSDRKNPRRLIRAIEIAQFNIKKPKVFNEAEAQKFNALFIGLTCPKDVLVKRIEKRVDERVKRGIESEIEKLLKNKVKWDSQSMSSLGYRQWKEFFEGKKNKAEVISLWKAEEKKYAKRQMTWFKSDPRISWFDVLGSDWQKKVEKLVKKWYSRPNATEKN